MSSLEALRKAEASFRSLDQNPTAAEVDKLNVLMQIQTQVLHEDPSYRCIESCLTKFLSLKKAEPASLRRFLAYFLEQVAIRKPKMALRCVPACISLLQDQDSVVRQLSIQSARSLQSRALLLIAKASPTQHSNVEAATQALMQLQERIWNALVEGVRENVENSSLSAGEGPFRQACLFVAHEIIITTSSCVFVRPSISPEQRGIASIEDIPQNPFLPVSNLTEKANNRLIGLLGLLEKVCAAGEKTPHHITSILDALGFVGRMRPQLITAILQWFQNHVGQDPWLDTHLKYHTRMFLACALAGDYHATCKLGYQ